MSTSTRPGVHFPLQGQERPTSPVVRGLLADAVRGVDPALAAEVESRADWRSSYVDSLRETTAASASSPEAARQIAADGLASMRRRLVLVEDDGQRETPLAEVTLGEPPAAEALATETVRGTGERAPELVVPYRGQELRGDALRAQLARWVAASTVEPSFAAAIEEVIDHPEWLRLPGRQALLIGAGAEMGPLESLLSWGVDVLAIDLPRSRAWRYKKGLAAGLAGSLSFPVDAAGDSGADIVHQPAAVLAWIRRARGEEPLAVGMHAYADSGVHVRVSAASDLLMTALTEEDRDTALAWLATPTDAFVVPPEVVAAAHRRWSERSLRLRGLQAPVRSLSRGRVFAPAYAGDPEDAPGVADVLIPQQGPNYAIAKRLQRWRGVSAEGSGQAVSFNVAPATWTRSVVKNPVLGAAYRGAHHFDIEVFTPETIRPLMAALLVRDLMGPAPTRRHPEELFSDAAAHGGLWRAGYEPKTALGVAAVAGLPGQLGSRLRRQR